MPVPPTIQRLRRLVLSATEIKTLTDWPETMVEDYLNILDNIITIVEILDGQIDKKIEETDTDFTDGSIPFAEGGFLSEDNANFFWDNALNILKVASVILNGSTASRLLATDADKTLVSTAISDWIDETLNQVIVTDNGDGSATLSLPQNIDADADVTFDTLGIDCINFNLTPGVTPSEGEMCWNSDEGTLNLGMPGGNVVLQLGQEILAPRAKAIGSNINNGDLVFVSGGSGNNPEMTLAKADALSTSMGTIAMATEDITQNQFGYFTALGLVRLLDTSAYAVGDILYLSAATAGAFTNVEPTRPNFAIRIGVVIRVSATEGIVYVDINERGLIHLQQDNEKILFGAASDASMYYDGTDFWIKLDEVAASDLKLDCGTNKTLELQQPVYEDLQVSISNVKIPAANMPADRLYNHGIVGGVDFPVLGFDLNEYIYFDVQTSHTMALNTILDHHIHFTTPTDGSATPDRFKFQLDVIAAGIDGTWSVPTGSPFTSEHIIASDYTNSHKYLEVAAIPAVNTTLSTLYKCKLTRVAATLNEYAGEVYLQFTDCHYQKNTMGSRQENLK